MAEKIGSIYYDLDLDDKKFNQGLQSASSKTKQFGQKMKATGATLTKTLTPVAAAVGALMGKAALDWNKGSDAIVKGTGAIGDELENMKGIMKEVAKKVPQNMGEVGQAVADLNTRLGLTGDQLRDTSKKALDFARVNNVEVSEAVRLVTRLMKDWGVPSREAGSQMDLLTRVSQITGASLQQLADVSTTYGVQLRTMGFSQKEAIVMMGKWEAEGVSTQKMVSGLSMALGRMAQKGIKDPVEGFKALTKEIKEAGTVGDATRIAIETLGTRAGPDFALAVREGRFELGDMIEALGDTSGATESAAKNTIHLKDKFAMLRNQLTGIIGPFGEVGAIIAGGVAAIGPLIFGLGALITALHGIKLASVLLFGAWTLGIMAAIAVIMLIVKNWDKVKEVIGKVVGFASDKLEKLKEIFNKVKDAVSSFVNDALGKLQKKLQSVKEWWDRNYQTIKNIATFFALIFGPAIIHHATLMVIQAVKAGTAWTIQMAKVSASAIKNFAIASAQAVKNGLVNTAQAIKSGAIWIAQMARASASVVLNFGLMSLAATRAGLQMMLAGARAALAWLLALGPIGLIVGAVAAAAFLIIKNWDKIKVIAGKVWEKIKGFVKSAFDWIKENWPLILAIITGPIGIATLVIKKNWDKIKAGFGAVRDFIKRAFEAVKNFLQTRIENIKNNFSRAFNFIKRIINTVRNFIVDRFRSAVNNIKNFFSGLIRAFKSIPRKIGNALKGVGEAIKKPFREAFNWIKKKASWAKDQLNKINPFHKESPSLIEWISKGTDQITDMYGKMFNSLDQMAVQNRMSMIGAASSLSSATGRATGDSLAPASITVKIDQSGIVARSRGEFRDIMADGISAVNEELRAKGQPEIGGGKIKGSSTR